ASRYAAPGAAAGVPGLACSLAGPPGFGRFAPVAVGVHLQDDGVVHQAVDGGDGHGGIGEDRIPGAEGLVCGDQQGPALVAGGDQLEDDGGLGLALLDVGQVVEDEQMVFVELLDGGRQLEVLAGGLQV